MGTLKLLIYGCVSEQAALLALFGPEPLVQRTVLFIVGHLIASALLALLLTNSFSKRFNAPQAGLYAFFFSFNFFVPALGAVGTLLTLFYFIRFLNNTVRTEFFSVPLPPFQVESAAMPIGMGEGGAWSRLRTVRLPRAHRMKALLAVGSSDGGNVSRFLQLATGDNDDEIRMLAFNLCGRQERSIQLVISTALERLKDADISAGRADLCRTLAFAYWEMVYNSLAQDKLQDFYMEQAVRYVRQALETGENSADLAVLMIRIHLKKRDVTQAERALEEAIALGVDRFRILPYQAEIAFHLRDYSTIKRLVEQSPMVKYRPSIGPVAQFWGGQ
jgi:hypothetical protein